MKKRFFSCLAMFLGMFLLLSGVKAEAEATTDWGTKMIKVIGEGVAPAGLPGAQGRVMAKRAAIADAYRQLAEAVKGVQVDANTTVEMAMVKSDTISLKVSALIKGAQIVSENVSPDGAYQVTMQIPMFGATGGLAEAVIPQPPVVEPLPQPAPEVIPSMPADSNTGGASTVVSIDGGNNSPMGAIGGYTGVIIDCRGLGLQPVMSPVIKNVKGVKLYGHENLNYDLVIRDGMADYATNEGMLARAGNRPLRIKAVRLEDHNANPVISEEDGSRILIENGVSGFLNKTAVVFWY